MNKYDKALEISENNIKYANDEDKFLYLDLLSFIYDIKKDFVKARNSYLDGIELAKSYYGEKSNEVADKYLSYSLFLIKINQFVEAESILNKAYQIIENQDIKDGILLAKYFFYSGDLFVKKTFESSGISEFKFQKKNNTNKAIELYWKGMDALRFPKVYTIDSVNIENVLSLSDCIQFLNKIGDNYVELWRLDDGEQKTISESLNDAINIYQLAGTVIQEARKKISNDEGKIQLTSLEYNAFLSLIKAAYSAYSISNDNKYLELAFQNAERTRGSSIFDQLSNQFAKENSLIPDSILQKEDSLNTSITSLSSELYEENSKEHPDSDLTKRLSDKLFRQRQNREELYQYMEKNYSDYYDLKYSNAMLSAKDIQYRLSGEQVLMEYVLNERDTISETDTITELYLFLITKDNIHFMKQNISPTFVTDIENVFKFMSNSNFLFTKNADSKRFCVSSHNLYNDLIKPVLGKIENKNLTVVPDGKLSYIPFDALLKTLPDTSKMIEFNKLSYLIRDFCVNYTVSANLLFKNKNSNHKAGVSTLAFAPDYNNDTIEVGGRNHILVKLPGVKKEVQNISNVLRTTVFEGDSATKTNFLRNVENFDILHFAMHAFINDSLPAFSSMAFVQTENDKSNTKDLLTTADIYNLKLNAHLVVLSACNTGSGKLLKGEGIMSLARGFLYAGCPSIIMSLWEVEDISGTKIITSFYKNLKKGKNKDEALRLAKLEYLESSNSRLAHPHYWLGFVDIGDNSSFFISYDFYFFVILVLALAGIGTDQLLRIRKARSKRAL